MKIQKTNSQIYTIAEEGLISNFDLAEGRMIPAVVLQNIDNDKLVENLVKIHLDTPPGDVTVTWGSPFNPLIRNKYWELYLKFSKPLECEFAIRFDLEKEHRTIDAIIHSRGLYISYGKIGDKVSRMKNGAILIEVPNTGVDNDWNKKLLEVLIKKYKKRIKNKSNKEIKRLAEYEIEEFRKLSNFSKKL
tara:strand:- start:20823 stop:21392 length:570 start_codon:yes stop_codon:yes gene_type:complete